MPCIDCFADTPDSKTINVPKNYVCDRCKYIYGEPMDCDDGDELNDLKVRGTVLPPISGNKNEWEKGAIAFASNIMQGNYGNIYCMLNAGLGYHWFVRRNIFNHFEAFFIHDDIWSRNTTSNSDITKLKKFLDGYRQF